MTGCECTVSTLITGMTPAEWLFLIVAAVLAISMYNGLHDRISALEARSRRRPWA